MISLRNCIVKKIISLIILDGYHIIHFLHIKAKETHVLTKKKNNNNNHRKNLNFLIK
jgi:hypothetical protein